jgi:hypothetical protein
MQKYSTPAIVPGGGKDALAIETLPDVQFGSVDVYLASEVDARIAELESLLRELDGHFKVLAASDIHVWPNHPLNPRKRIADALRADS